MKNKRFFLAVMFGLVLTFGLIFSGCSSGGGGDEESGDPIKVYRESSGQAVFSSGSLDSAFDWLKTAGASNTGYRITVRGNHVTAGIAIQNYPVNMTITLEGIGEEPIIELIDSAKPLFTIYQDYTLILGEHITLKGLENGNPSLVKVESQGKLIMRGAKITGHTSSNEGGGVHVNPNAVFIMEYGSITGNTAKNNGGGGVYINSGSTFTMEGGSITDNVSGNGNGGGVLVNPASTFTMKNGTITGNIVNNNGSGGGVYINSNAVFNMQNGTIAGNTVNFAHGSGGGVYVNNSGTISKTGGIITGYGNDRETGNKVWAGNAPVSSKGHAVYANIDQGRRLENTVDANHNLNSSSAGGWTD
ncbi:MAG: right-handed parallel beta-helix repeat-containing protein [Treponema sp.]|jgi:hypothetical protein|nr:right-handed parallel beta-helix repeat-containing protein [Treponema sp.]